MLTMDEEVQLQQVKPVRAGVDTHKSSGKARWSGGSSQTVSNDGRACLEIDAPWYVSLDVVDQDVEATNMKCACKVKKSQSVTVSRSYSHGRENACHTHRGARLLSDPQVALSGRRNQPKCITAMIGPGLLSIFF